VAASGGSGAGANVCTPGVAVLFGLAVSPADHELPLASRCLAILRLFPGQHCRWLRQQRGQWILVDFRAVDTLGEILVVCELQAAPRRCWVRANLPKRSRVVFPEFGSLMLPPGYAPAGAKILLVVIAVRFCGVVTTLPGGGFIGGLVAATGFHLDDCDLVAGFSVAWARIATATIIVWAWPARSVRVGLGLPASCRS